MAVKSFWKSMGLSICVKCTVLHILEDGEDTLYVYKWYSRNKKRWMYAVIQDYTFDREVEYRVIHGIVE